MRGGRSLRGLGAEAGTGVTRYGERLGETGPESGQFSNHALTSVSGCGAALAAAAAEVVTEVVAVVVMVSVVLAVAGAGSTDTVGCAVLVLVLAANRALVCNTWLSGAPGLAA